MSIIDKNFSTVSLTLPADWAPAIIFESNDFATQQSKEAFKLFKEKELKYWFGLASMDHKKPNHFYSDTHDAIKYGAPPGECLGFTFLLFRETDAATK